MMKWLILLALAFCLAGASDDGDWVDPSRLPVDGFPKSFYAGYLKIHSGKQLYYVYTPSEDSPSKDPLVVVVSGGPGCSSLHSWLYSKGEFIFTRNSHNFRNNAHNWNKVANVLYIEGPAGTGFSYGASGNITDDTTQAQYFKGILSFYVKFPELKDQRLYLSGVGYAGIIVPKLALHIIEHNADPDTLNWQKMNISGIFLLNPCTVHEECNSFFEFNQYTVQALRNNFFIDSDDFQKYKSHCKLRTPACVQDEKRIESNFKLSGADLRNLFKECLQQKGDYGCLDHIGIDAFLNLDSVKEDMNVKKESDKQWQVCNFNLSQDYQRDPSGSLYTYETLLREQHNLRIWIVSGTQSAVVPTLGTKRWVDEVKLTMRLPTLRLWEPWFYQNINAGQIETIPGLTLVTLRSAGFYMFQDQPELAWHVYTSFLKGQPL